MTRKWLVTILVVIAIVLVAVWLYTGYASEEIESEVGRDEVSLLFSSDLLGAARPGCGPPRDRIDGRPLLQ